jgi:hypothetical protein
MDNITTTIKREWLKKIANRLSNLDSPAYSLPRHLAKRATGAARKPVSTPSDGASILLGCHNRLRASDRLTSGADAEVVAT